MPTAQHGPFAAGERALEMVGSFIPRKRHRWLVLLSAMRGTIGVREQDRAAQMFLKPFTKRPFQTFRNWNSTGCLLSFVALLFADQHEASFEVDIGDSHAQKLGAACAGVRRRAGCCTAGPLPSSWLARHEAGPLASPYIEWDAVQPIVELSR